MPYYDHNKDYPFAAFITNLGKYNEGELVGECVKFPTTAEELKEVFKRIGIGQKDDFGQPYEEWFITDYDLSLIHILNATCGRKCAALLPSCGPAGCLGKMLLASSIWGSTKRSLTSDLNDEELAFYDALTKPEAVRDFYTNEQLVAITPI